MTFDYQLTADDYVEAQRIHTRKHFSKSVWVLVVFAFMIVLGIVCFGLWVAGQKPPATTLWILDISLLGAYAWLWSGFAWRKQFRKIQALQAPLKMTVSDEGIFYESARGSSTTMWAAFEDWRESKTLFLFYPQPSMFFILPKRIMGPEQVSAFREVLTARVRKS